MFEAAVSEQLSQLAQRMVAGTANTENLRTLRDLETLIKAFEQEQSVETGLQGLRYADRLRLLHNNTRHSLREKLNQVKDSCAASRNDSAQQAAFLNGFRQKFAAKALRRSGAIDTDFQTVLRKVLTNVEDLKTFESQREPEPEPEAEESRSFISLNTPREQLLEWPLVQSSLLQDAYSLLVAYGFCGVPIQMIHCAATQMDPYQTRCLSIEPHVVDSASVMLAHRTNRPLRSPSGKDVSDILVLFTGNKHTDAMLQVAIRSPVYEFLCSVTLCRDLYMYHLAMPMSLHCHALLQCVELYFLQDHASVYLQLARRILHSLTKLNKKPFRTLLMHWFRDWESITQSERDGCAHPVQLIAALAVYALESEQQHTGNLTNHTSATNLTATTAITTSSPASLSTTPLTTSSTSTFFSTSSGSTFSMSTSSTAATETTATLDLTLIEQPLMLLLNEVLARECRMLLKSRVGNNTTDTHATQTMAHDILCGLYGITPENSPQADLTNPMDPEPDTDNVRRTCNSNHVLQMDVFKQQFGLGQDLEAFVLDKVSPYFRAFHWALHPDVNHLNHINIENERRVLETMFVQAMMHHSSSGRASTDDWELPSVKEASTLRDLQIDLHMRHYERSCATKTQLWTAQIGEVTLAKTLRATPDEYEQFIGRHSHGMCRSKFKAFAKAANADTRKLDIFLRKSNNTVPIYLNRLKTFDDATQPIQAT